MTTTSEQPPLDSDPLKLKQEALNRISLAEQSGLIDLVGQLKKQFKHLLDPEVPLETQSTLRKFVTQDSAMMEVKTQVGLLAEHQDTVLISGPTGTGKEILARALHGDRPKDKFFALNCAGLPDNLIESILFGHVKGSFTGAERTTEGAFRLANEGTLLLDEVGELSIQVQAKLLRVIQEREVCRVGGDKYEPVTCRIVCATLKNLEKMVEDYRFREDLFWRINTFHLQLTSLKDRVEDIPPITRYVAETYESELRVKPENKFPVDEVHLTPSKLSGNVRSIQQIIRRYHLFGKVALT